jgi:hypothetical protein
VGGVDTWNAEVDRRDIGWAGYSESGGEASPCKGGAPPAGMETGEQHAVGVVLGGPGGERPNCDVGAQNITEHVLY